MTDAQTNEPTPRKPLRFWPGIVLAVLQLLIGFVLPKVWPDQAIYGFLGPVVAGLLIFVWWVFFSRARWFDRLGAVALMIVSLVVTKLLVHKSIAGAGMGMLIYIFAIPVLTFALVLWAVATRRLSDGFRRVSLVAVTLLACGVLLVIRTGGISGEGKSDFHLRWTKDPEERLLTQPVETMIAASSAPALPETPIVHPRAIPGKKLAPPPLVNPPAMIAAEWPGFRGPDRNSIVTGVRIRTDWSAAPPVQLWRRPIGPGWSSFAVQGDLFYTQEQRGEGEVVACYKLSTGEPVWRHRDAARFYESNGGAGPRATPTLSHSRVFTLGATGIVNALEAATGAVVWMRSAQKDTGAKLPGWGFAGSPLVVNDAVIVAASGRLAAYDAASGNLRWTAQTGGGGFSSPHLVTLGGVAQVLLLSSSGLTSFAPEDGKQLWAAPLPTGSRIVQPAVTSDGDILMTTGDEGMGGGGLRRIAVTQGSSGWTVQERWTSRGLKPNFNDFVLHKGHAYGFDGSILSCIALADGQRKWKGGRYGNGQLVLLPDQDLLLVLSEEGELALVRATPDPFTELARFKAIEGKTWNHPVLVRDVLLVRNGEEMAAFRLSLESGTSSANTRSANPGN